MRSKLWIRITSVLLLVTGAVGCGPDSVSAEELRKFLVDPDNGVRKVATINDFTIEVSLRPTDFLVLQEVSSDSIFQERIEELRAKYGRYFYFLLSLSKNGQEALRPSSLGYDYSELVNVLSFRMGSYINLTTSRLDTIPLADAILTPTYGMSRSTDVILVFNREKSIETDWVQLNVNEFGMGIGNHRFRFMQSDLERIPKLDFDIPLTLTP